MSEVLLDERIKAILRDADRAVVKMIGESHHLLYRYLHTTAARIALTDSFYIGFYCETNLMVFPYSFDGKAYFDPNKFPTNPEGLSVWIQRNRVSYTYRQDNGTLMHKGKSYGAAARVSKDGVVVPIFNKPVHKEDAAKVVIGVMAMQTYSANTYDDQTVSALEWLANGLSLVLSREHEDHIRQSSLGDAFQLIHDPMLRPDNIVNEMLEKMASIRRKVSSANALLKHASPLDHEELVTAMAALQDECERRQTETIELFLHSALTKPNPLSLLTKQQKVVATALVQSFEVRPNRGFTNEELADHLHVEPSTIKTHLQGISAKIGTSGRTAMVEKLRPFVPETKPRNV